MSAADKILAITARHAEKVVPIAPAPAAATTPVKIELPAGIASEVQGAAAVAATDDAAAILAQINSQFAFVSDNGNSFVLEDAYDYELDQPSIVWHRKEAFESLHMNRFVTVMDASGNTRQRPVGQWWLSHPGRRQYRNGVALLPGVETPPGVYNLWRGFGVVPAQNVRREDVRWFLEFLLDVICARNAQAFVYLVKWLASAVQHPERQAEVAIVLLGGRGVGKGTLGWMFCNLFGAHGTHIQSSRHLIGNFNAHLRHTIALFADESLFVGDRAGNSVLKSLITENAVQIERKGVDAKQSRNRLKIIMATNDDHAIIAGEDERRYCVLEVSSTKQQDTEYFSGLRRHWAAGGAEQVLGFLLAQDIKNFNIRKAPNTGALERQKLQSLGALDAWLFACLQEGRITSLDKEWKTDQPRRLVAEEFTTYVRSRGLRYVNTSADATGRGIRQRMVLGDGRQSTGGRDRLWVFPALADARRMFADSLRLEHFNWDKATDGDGGDDAAP